MDAYAKSKTPKEDRDKRQTPVCVFERIEELLKVDFVHDVCAERHTTKCFHYWDEDDNALTIDWYMEIAMSHAPYDGIPAAFMNPPYSDPGTWCEKAHSEAQKGMIVVGLVPDDRSTGWYQNWIEDKAQIIYVPDRRISFEDAEGVPQTGNPKGSVFPVWMPFQLDKSSYVRFKL